jgi:Casein Kinase 2 substrate
MSALTIIHLSKADSLCRDWVSLQNSGIALLSSLANTLQQRSATLNASIPLLGEDQKAALIYKQTAVFEETFTSFNAIIPKFRVIVDQFTTLVKEAAKNASYAANEQTTSPRVGTSAALLSTAAISEEQTSIYISQIRDMYNQEYTYKVTLSNQLYQLAKLNAATINDINSLWSAQPQIDFTVEKDMAERLNLYKKVKKIVEAKD